MPTFFYKAKNYEGKSIQGELEGDTKEQVIARLRERGLFITAIEKENRLLVFHFFQAELVPKMSRYLLKCSQ